MKGMNIFIKWGLGLALVCLAFVSCKDDFDVEKLQDSPRLVVYCFPTEGDTTLIAVTKSLPIASFKGDKDVQSHEKVDAHIIYKVNGVECPVKRIENKQEAQLFTESKNDWALENLVGQYYAVGKQKEGDKVSLEASAEGCSTVSASTYIPGKVNVKLGEVRLEEKSTDGDSYVDKLEASFQDDASAEDYYFVKVKYKSKGGFAMGIAKDKETSLDTVYVYQSYEYYELKDDYSWNFDSLFWYVSSRSLQTASEPILNKKTKLDEDFGIDDYDFYDNAYIFNDRMINGRNYTLHLEADYGSYGNYYDHNFDWTTVFGCTYVVELYKITPEYYRFLKSIDDAQSNSWADAGLMQVTPTYSNVRGGFGVVAGYQVSSGSKYFEPSGNGGLYTK